MIELVSRFASRGAERRTQHENELAWGEIRSIADAARAFYRTPYLQTTYVLTPKTLRLPLRKEETPFGRVLTVDPTFDGAPEGWLKAFYGFNFVQPHYNLVARDGGHVKVVALEAVRRVLDVIKRDMPGRRVAGSAAERSFTTPPRSSAKRQARYSGRGDCRGQGGRCALAVIFSVTPRIRGGYIEAVDLCVTEHFYGGSASTETVAFSGADELERFAAALEHALRDDRVQFAWKSST
ncbi:MAG: hypothetical protein U5L03_12265 [Burkholderiaceae bacterium]|nr:hypothetical protein [Burkholderiaceae bacterium]